MYEASYVRIRTSDFRLRTPNFSTTLSSNFATSPTQGPLGTEAERENILLQSVKIVQRKPSTYGLKKSSLMAIQLYYIILYFVCPSARQSPFHLNDKTGWFAFTKKTSANSPNANFPVDMLHQMFRCGTCFLPQMPCEPSQSPTN